VTAIEHDFVYQTLVQTRLDACALWPTRAMPADYFSQQAENELQAKVPMLVFSGSQDPVTPRRWGEQVAMAHPNSLHIEAKGVGHGVFQYGCTTDLIAHLVEQGSLQAVDAACLQELQVRPFFVSASGGVQHD
jgi:pimeloyl-ACP methyl ester carboxylesterase